MLHGLPFSSALSSGTHTKQVVNVRVKMEHQELGVFSNVRILILRRVTTTVLQPVVLRGEVIVHLHTNSRHYLEQGSSNLTLEVQSAAEFSSNPDQTHLPVIF